MTVAAGGEAVPLETPNQVATKGAVVGLVGIYLVYLNDLLGVTYFAFLAGIGAVFAIRWGADAVRRVCSYGIGTGVPSIGMLALGMGLVAAIFGLALGARLGPALGPMSMFVGPIAGFIVAVAIGWVIGTLANKVIKLNIPIMERCCMEIAGAGVLAMIGLSTVIAGSFDFALIVERVIQPGYIAPVFILGALGILHPFNANLGPDEVQDRTLTQAYSTGAIAMTIAGICSVAVLGSVALIAIVIGFVIWYVNFTMFFRKVERDAYKYAGTGLLPPGAM